MRKWQWKISNFDKISKSKSLVSGMISTNSLKPQAIGPFDSAQTHTQKRDSSNANANITKNPSVQHFKLVSIKYIWIAHTRSMAAWLCEATCCIDRCKLCGIRCLAGVRNNTLPTSSLARCWFSVLRALSCLFPHGLFLFRTHWKSHTCTRAHTNTHNSS